MRRVRQLHLCLPDGRHLYRSGDQARHRQSDECVECYACFNGLSQEHLNPTMVRTVRKVFQWMRAALRSRAGRLPHGRLRAGRAGVAARGAARVLRSARAARIHRRRRARHRRGEDQRRQRARQGGRGRIHHRVRTARSGRLVPRYAEDVLGAGRGGRQLREKESGHLADVRCRRPARFAKTS